MYMSTCLCVCVCVSILIMVKVYYLQLFSDSQMNLWLFFLKTEHQCLQLEVNFYTFLYFPVDVDISNLHLMM